MSSENLSLLTEAKTEYTNTLITTMSPVMLDTFKKLHSEAARISKGKKTLLQFQQLLRGVQDWSNTLIKDNTEAIERSCSWFNELVTAVFVSYVKILSAVRINGDSRKIKIKLPTLNSFVHKCYVEAAKNLYRDPYIFQNADTEDELDDKVCERIGESISTTIKEMLPLKQILETYISEKSLDIENDDVITDDPEVEEEEEEDEVEVEEEEQEEQEDPTKDIDLHTSKARTALETTADPSMFSQPQEPPPQEEEEEDDDDILFPNA